MHVIGADSNYILQNAHMLHPLYLSYLLLGDNSQPTTMRQTNVVVLPNCDELQPFSTFDKLVHSINQARRSARDFVLKKKSDDDDSKDWV